MVEVNWALASWRKSQRSTDGQGGCLEVAVVDDVVGLRDSKDPDGPVLTFSIGAWQAFVHALRQGELGG